MRFIFQELKLNQIKCGLVFMIQTIPNQDLVFRSEKQSKQTSLVFFVTLNYIIRTMFQGPSTLILREITTEEINIILFPFYNLLIGKSWFFKKK